MPANTRDLSVGIVLAADLKPNRHNPRTHSHKQIKRLASSIQSFGFTNPIWVDGSNTVVAGNGRLVALKMLGRELTPVIRLAAHKRVQ